MIFINRVPTSFLPDPDYLQTIYSYTTTYMQKLLKTSIKEIVTKILFCSQAKLIS